MGQTEEIVRDVQRNEGPALFESDARKDGAGMAKLRSAADLLGASPVALLIVVGALMGLQFPLAKAATGLGASPFAYAFWTALGSGVLILLVALARGLRPAFGAPYIRYYLVTGALSAFINIVAFSAVEHLGAGLTAVVYTLPPLVTYGLAVVLGVEPMRIQRAGGIALGLAGALMIVLPQGNLPAPELAGWMGLALSIPLAIGAGNMYRTLAWPKGADPILLAAGSLLSAAVLNLPVAVIADGAATLAVFDASAAWITAMQAVVSAAAFIHYFKLQRLAGPVYLSQIGYVMTLMGLLTGVLIFCERYSLWIWAAVGVVAAGIALVNRESRSVAYKCATC